MPMEELHENLSQAEEKLREAEERMQRARAEQRRQALSELGGARELLALARADEERAKKAFDEADERVQQTVYRGMDPEEAARRTEKDYKAAVSLLKLAGKLPPVWISYIPLGLSVPAFVMAFVTPWKLPCIGVGSILMLLFVVMFPRLKELARTRVETLETRERILNAYGVGDPEEIPELLRAYRQLYTQRETARIRLEDAQGALAGAERVREKVGSTAVSSLDFVNGSTEAARLGREIRELRAECDRLRAEAEKNSGSNLSPDDV